MAVFRHVTLWRESQSTIDKHCPLRPFTVFSAPKMAPNSDAPSTGLLVRQFSIVFFGMFTLTSQSFGVNLELVVAKGISKRVASLGIATLA